MGLGDPIKEVQLLAQINEGITFDGMGYDLISLNEFGERICIEVKTNIGKSDKPFFISKKEIEIIEGYKEEFDCTHCFIYYVLIDDTSVTIKKIDFKDFDTYKLEPILYKIKEA